MQHSLWLFLVPLFVVVAAPNIDSTLWMTAGAGAFLSMLISIRRTLATKVSRRIGRINAALAMFGGLSMGIIFAEPLTGLKILGVTNSLPPYATAFVIALLSSIVIDVISDGTVKDYFLSKYKGSKNDSL